MHKLGLCFLALTFGFPSAAQEFNLGDNRIPIAELHGLARFHTGDDLRWSDPNFDDAQWPLARIDQPWSTQGFKSDSGFAWYRFKIVVSPGSSHLGFYYPNPFDCYELYVGGRLAAKYGGLPPNPRVFPTVNYQPAVQRLPDELLPAGGTVQAALRGGTGRTGPSLRPGRIYRFTSATPNFSRHKDN